MLVSSCVNYKKFTYLQTPFIEKPDSLYLAKIIAYHLQPADILNVSVASLDENINKLFNIESAVSSSTVASSGGNGGGFYLSGYSIDTAGNISLPIIGKVLVGGLTVGEAQQKVQQLAETYINNAKVDVKLVSFKISKVGEIKRPGQYTIFNDKANIFEAISLAGDISYNGNRKKVFIVRSYSNGNKTIQVDVTQRSILSSSQYYLQPNDIIYVEPLRSTVFRIRIADYSTFLTLITSTVTVILLITQVK